MNKKYFLLFLIPAIFCMLYFGNIKPLKASRITIQGDIKKALNYNTFINHEIRKGIAKKSFESEDLEFGLIARDEMEKNIKERPYDAKSYILLTYLYYRLGQDDQALQTAEKLLKLAPNRPDAKELYNKLKSNEPL